jgi:hypothetical protein
MDHHQPYFRRTLGALSLLLITLPQAIRAQEPALKPTLPSPQRHGLNESLSSTLTPAPQLSLPLTETHLPLPLLTPATPPPFHRPALLQLSLGFPIPISLGANLPLHQSLDLGITATHLPLPFIKSGTLITTALDTVLKWHPMDFKFFIFGGMGAQYFSFHTSVNLGRFSESTGPEQGRVSLTRIYTSVGVGMTWISSPRISLESDLGIQIPILKSGKISFDTTSEAKSSLEEASRDALSYYAGFILPRVTLLRFGIKI